MIYDTLPAAMIMTNALLTDPRNNIFSTAVAAVAAVAVVARASCQPGRTIPQLDVNGIKDGNLRGCIDVCVQGH